MKHSRRRAKSKRRTASSAAKAPRRKSRVRRAAGKPPRKRSSAESRLPLAELEREIRRLRAARSRLERQLTEAVQEIGTLRQFEIRAQALETELASLRSDDRLGGAMIISAPSTDS